MCRLPGGLQVVRFGLRRLLWRSWGAECGGAGGGVLWRLGFRGAVRLWVWVVHVLVYHSFWFIAFRVKWVVMKESEYMGI